MILFYLLIAIMPLSHHDLWGRNIGNVTVIKCIGLVCLIYAVVHVLRSGKVPPFFSTRQEKLFLALVVVSAISYFTKGLPGYAVEENPFVSYVCFLLLLFITVSVVDTLPRLRWTLFAGLIAVAYGSLYTIREWQKYHGTLSGFRADWVVGDSNYFAVSVALFLPFGFLYTFSSRPRWERTLCGTCTLLSLVAVMISASRGGFLALLAGLLYLVSRSRRPVHNFALIAAILLPIILLSPRSPLDRLRHPDETDRNNFEIRVELWRVGWRMIQAEPLTGVGLGNFKPLVQHYAKREMPEGIACNTFVEVTAEQGIPVLLLFLALLYSIFRSLELSRRRAAALKIETLPSTLLALQAGMVGYVVGSLSLSTQYQKMFWLLAFVSVSVANILRDAVTEARRNSQRDHPAAAFAPIGGPA